jgi:predicted amino acid racemase
MSPHLIVHLGHITENAARTVALCRPYGIEVVGITKGVCGRPEIARAMLEGGIEILGDARLDNIARMREAGIEAPMLLVRSPGLSEIGSCVELAEYSLNADLGVLRALSREAARTGRRHGVILMVDLNTGREGFAPAELMEVCETAASENGLQLNGLGIYFHFASSADHQAKGLERLVSLASEVGAALGVSLPVISGGSTNAFHTLVVNGAPNPGIRQLRIGTAILLGLAASVGPVPGSRFKVPGSEVPGSMFKVQGSGVPGSGFNVQCSMFNVQGSEVPGSGSRVS